MGVVTKTKLALNNPELRVENKISTEKKNNSEKYNDTT